MRCILQPRGQEKSPLLRTSLTRRATSCLPTLEIGEICHGCPSCGASPHLCAGRSALALPERVWTLITRFSAGNAEFPKGRTIRKASLTDARTNQILRGRVYERGVVFCLFAVKMKIPVILSSCRRRSTRRWQTAHSAPDITLNWVPLGIVCSAIPRSAFLPHPLQR